MIFLFATSSQRTKLLENIKTDRTRTVENKDHWDLIETYNNREILLTHRYRCLTKIFGVVVLIFNLFEISNELRLPLKVHLAVFPVNGFSVNWALNLFHQSMVSIFAFILYNAYFPLIMVIINHASFKIEALIVNIKKYHETLEFGPIDVDSWRLVLNRQIMNGMKNYVKESSVFLEYRNEVQTLIKNCIGAEFFILTLWICLNVFVISKSGVQYSIAYVVIAIAFPQLLFYCYVGAKFKVLVDKVGDDLYDLPWYKFSPDQRRHFLLILKMSHNIGDLHGMFFTLSMESFYKVHVINL
jgi:7tm Odorant receptor